MKRTLIISGAILLLGASQVLKADDTSSTTSSTTTSSSDDTKLFNDEELSIDLFGSDTLGRHTVDHPSGDRIRHNSVLSAGAGGEVFFLRYLGIGGDAYTENTAHSFIDDASGYGIIRIPIDVIHLSPYAFGGGGYKFDPVTSKYALAGGGLEFRIIHNVGIFADARYVFADRVASYWFGRAGVRLSF